MNIGYSILIIALSIVAFLIYEDVTTKRREIYFKRLDLTEEERRKEMKNSWGDRMAILVRLIIYVVSAVFGFLGDALGFILTVFFTVEGIAHIYYEAIDVEKSRAVALTFLGIPFATVVTCAISQWTSSIILGLIVGAVILVTIRFAGNVWETIRGVFKRITTFEDEAKEKETPVTEHEVETPRVAIRRTQSIKGGK